MPLPGMERRCQPPARALVLVRAGLLLLLLRPAGERPAPRPIQGLSVSTSDLRTLHRLLGRRRRRCKGRPP